ncbi:MAG: flagellin-like protein [Ruminococcus sp.]|nr:flagellin-like protein [Ruminococcus sp.]
MDKVDVMLLRLVVQAKMFAWSLVYDEEGDVNIVSMVVLIGVAVLLAMLFKEQIGNLLTTMLDTITGKANEAVTQGVN